MAILFLFIFLFIFLFGLIIGSFLNVVIYRLKYPSSSKRSFCPHCRHNLSFLDLIPLLSFLFLKGKCRYCKKSISLQYPLVELAMGVLFVLSAYNIFLLRAYPISSPVFLFLFYQWLIISFLIVIFVYDFKYFIIPDEVIYPAILIVGAWLLFRFFAPGVSFKFEAINALYFALGSAIFFLSIFLVSRGSWLGFGDVKLAFFLGLFLGQNIIVALFLAFFIGAIIGLALIISGKKRLKSQVPFAPFLISGSLIALFWGNNILFWYFNLIGL